jgi:hypothetical protein
VSPPLYGLRFRAKTQFVPENTHLGTYTFLPWVRSGIAAALDAPTGGAIRAGVSVTLPVLGKPDPVSSKVDLEVRGPGDVVSLDGSQIIRRYPSPGTANAEDAFLAHVEFDRPDLPWLFSPAQPGADDRLSPWLALVVVRESAGQVVPGKPGFPPVLRTVLGELQPLGNESWAWAHAQVTGGKDDASPVSVEDRLSADYALVNLSRLLCPRRLAPETSYVACVVPTIQAGMLAALGNDVDSPHKWTLEDAWSRDPAGGDANEPITLPCFDHWSFATGPDGDFESLAKKLVPKPAPWSVGRRPIDTSRPAGGLGDLPAGSPGTVQVIRAPLVSPSPPPAGAPAEDAQWPSTETDALLKQLDLPDELSSKPGQPSTPGQPSETDLPLIGPPIYGGRHAGIARLDPSKPDPQWLDELNLQPTNRVVAGLGTRVVGMDQEQLMQAAWSQLGSLSTINQSIRWAQVARFAGASLHGRHLSTLSLGDLAQVTRRLQGRVMATAGLTVRGEIAGSFLAASATTGAFRRLTRPRGPLGRFAGGAAAAPLRSLVAVDAASFRDFQRPYVDLDCVASISADAASALDPNLVADVLGGAPANAEQTVLAHGTTLAAARPSFTALAKVNPGSIKLNPSIDLAALGAQTTLSAVEKAAPVEPAATHSVVFSHLALLHGLQVAGSPVAAPAGAFAHRLASAATVQALAPAAAAPIAARSGQVAASIDAAASAQPIDVATALQAIAGRFVSPDAPVTPSLPAPQIAAASLLASIHPKLTVTSRITARLGELPDWLAPLHWFDDGLVRPIMAAPLFNRPMYQALDDYDREWLVPGLAAVPIPDLVSLLTTNGTFVEAFLVGLSHEFGRELLWRSYPTDQRGTYFKRFWTSADDLPVPIHLFDGGGLGTHLDQRFENKVVLVVRGELLRRYPEATFYALKANPLALNPRGFEEGPATMLFHSPLPPDTLLVAFDLSVQDVVNDGWWFFVAEHPTAPRFGLADGDLAAGAKLTRDDAAWGAGGLPQRLGFLTVSQTVNVVESDTDQTVTVWGKDAVSVAHILLRDPFRAAFDGAHLVGQ